MMQVPLTERPLVALESLAKKVTGVDNAVEALSVESETFNLAPADSEREPADDERANRDNTARKVKAAMVDRVALILGTANRFRL